MASSASPLVALIHNLPAAQLDEASVERLHLPLVPIDIRWPLLALLRRWSGPICCAVGLRARFEIVIADEDHWKLEFPSRLDDQLSECPPFSFARQIKSGFAPPFLLYSV